MSTAFKKFMKCHLSHVFKSIFKIKDKNNFKFNSMPRKYIGCLVYKGAFDLSKNLFINSIYGEGNLPEIFENASGY